MKKNKGLWIVALVVVLLIGGPLLYDNVSRLSEDEYEDAIDDAFNDISYVMTDFSNVVNSGMDVEIRTSAYYESEVKAVSDDMLDIIEEVRDIKPPRSKKDEYDDILKAMDSYEIVAKKMPNAVANLDYDEMDVILNHMSKATRIIERVLY